MQFSAELYLFWVVKTEQVGETGKLSQGLNHSVLMTDPLNEAVQANCADDNGEH